MKLSELIYRAAGLRERSRRLKEEQEKHKPEFDGTGKRIEKSVVGRKVYRRRKVNGLVTIPNRIRKRFLSAPR